ncbi:MAG: 2Fe-2S iron-sulfur cluster-binding protein [Gammaproteobacteria bacterium]|jgi:2Fe-2S ferredoxin|nr:2Fe-2S iron-sulfur cluster-binding protein [Gammaproteobacteria bacterium]
MPKVIFVTGSGDAVQCEAKAGFSLMEIAVDNEVPGVVAECGGACACATCHVYVEESWLPRLPNVDDMEDAMLDATVDRRPNSRLSCQIEVTAELDGLTVTVADNQA